MESFEENINIFLQSIDNKITHINTEETTKTALILPFLQLMGYDTSNPTEVKMEFTADIGAKQGEKIDIAILLDNQEKILIECKSAKTDLSRNHLSQLLRYFSITEAEIGILTNGIIYQFFTDSKKNGRMDESPFLEFNLRQLSTKSIKDLEKFRKDKFDMNKIKSDIDDLKYKHDIKKVLDMEISSPSDEFVKVIAKQVYNGKFTSNTLKKFKKIVKNELDLILDERAEGILKEAIEQNNRKNIPKKLLEENNSEIITTEEEIEGYYIIKSICGEEVDVNRIVIHDHKSYCSVELDGKSKYTIARMYFNNIDQLRLGLFEDFNKNKKGNKNLTMIPLKELKDIYKYKEPILKTVQIYNREIKRKSQRKRKK